MESVHGDITVTLHDSMIQCWLVYTVKEYGTLFNWNIQTTNNHLVNAEVAEVKSFGNNSIVAT